MSIYTSNIIIYNPTMGKSTIIGSLTTAALLGVSGFLIWKYALDSPTNTAEAQQGAQDLWKKAQNFSLDDFAQVLEGGLDGLDFGQFFDNDPKLGDNTTYVWKSDFIEPNNGGLHLTLLNALDDTWQQEFEDAIADWEQSPALTLDPQRVAVDYDCNRVDGVMVVCNANFGETGWVGINENEIVGGVIYSSVAKMNEYYLRNAEYDHRRYTMCHEVGHGFGLPHTDENPYNANLGNCLDYTDNPDENLHPGDVNFNKLAGMYLSGNRRKTRRLGSNGRIMETHMLVVDWDVLPSYDEDLID
ncbi:hypothetical protein HJC23_009005 [Cyclotella cryptica]|uniref:Peptidase M10 metallopeptidase domain-containing protein n=1 Tax=Cyclotella cryptica TaxID=29204 RepID=A0ABD3QYK0_9STRA